MRDLIERQAAIDVIDAVFPVDPMKSEYAQGIACGAALAKTYVEQLPSAQPERKKGCKIVKSTGRYGYCACDQCGKPVHPEDLFCSKCSADFREEDA